MKISTFIRLLQDKLSLHGDRDVLITWEGTEHNIYPDCVYLVKDGQLLVNADGNWLKDVEAVDPQETWIDPTERKV